jgi:hypothetical protein
MPVVLNRHLGVFDFNFPLSWTWTNADNQTLSALVCVHPRPTYQKREIPSIRWCFDVTD